MIKRFLKTLGSNLEHHGGDGQSESSGEDLGEELAGGAREIVGIPAVGASAISGKLSAVGIGGERSASICGIVNGVLGSARVARGTGVVVAVGDGSASARSVVGVTTLTLLAKQTLGGSGRRRSLVSGVGLAVGDGGNSTSGVASNGVWSSGGGVNVENSSGLASEGVPGEVGTVGVGTRVVHDVAGGSGQRGGACVRSQRSGANSAGSPVEASVADVGSRASHAVHGSGTAGAVSHSGHAESNHNGDKEFHFL